MAEAATQMQPAFVVELSQAQTSVPKHRPPQIPELYAPPGPGACPQL
jgi:hypothetical protein